MLHITPTPFFFISFPQEISEQQVLFFAQFRKAFRMSEFPTRLLQISLLEITSLFMLKSAALKPEEQFTKAQARLLLGINYGFGPSATF